jgi:hypothetical protein
VRFLAVFTGKLEDQHNYPEQLLDAFPNVDFGDRIRLAYFQDAEHAFTSDADRMRLDRLVVDWAAHTAFPAGPEARSPQS